MICDDQFYFVISNETMKMAEAIDILKDPEQKPGYIIPQSSIWWKINYADKGYLCVAGPVSQNGEAAAYQQYYLIENAFDKDKKKTAYYYFFGFH